MNNDATWDQINLFANFFNSGQDLQADRIARVAPGGCDMRHVAQADEQNFQQFATALQHLSAYPGYHVVELRFQELVPSHLCALHTGLRGMAFFEPNSDEYYVPAGSEADFLRALSAQYRTHVSSTGQAQPLNFSHVYIYHLG